jgi:predicted DNA-binding protein (MmcQ/YjbR family)
MGKMFALTDIDEFRSINLKCEPDKALELRAEYMQVGPGYHMNKKHWNTIIMTGQLDDEEVKDLARLSYRLVTEA